MKVVGIIDVNSTIFFICEREEGAIHIGSPEFGLITHNFAFYALVFHDKAKNAVTTQA